MEEVKEIYDNLTEENKEVINLVAKGMLVAQNSEKKEE